MVSKSVSSMQRYQQTTAIMVPVVPQMLETKLVPVVTKTTKDALKNSSTRGEETIEAGAGELVMAAVVDAAVAVNKTGRVRVLKVLSRASHLIHPHCGPTSCHMLVLCKVMSCLRALLHVCYSG